MLVVVVVVSVVVDCCVVLLLICCWVVVAMRRRRRHRRRRRRHRRFCRCCGVSRMRILCHESRIPFFAYHRGPLNYLIIPSISTPGTFSTQILRLIIPHV